MSAEKNLNENAAEQSQLEDSSVTMLDVLEQEKEMEEEYAAVLGASDEKCCTYSLGPVKRQALYSCLTCCPEAQSDLDKCAGICLACSYRCHENHELVELYTKRNFRCDCPTERMANAKCLLNPANVQPHPKNPNNHYNHNFQGLYCKCKRPYPDPDRTKEEVMLQCTICEDWFHLPHMVVGDTPSKLIDDCAEMICDSCMEKHAFLHDYKGLALKGVTPDDSVANISVCSNNDDTISEENEKPKLEAEENISKIASNGENGENGNVKDDKAGQEKDKTDKGEPESKRPKLENGFAKDSKPRKSDTCKRPKSLNKDKGATFWGTDLRTSLCSCKDCLAMYKEQQVEFLLDSEDSAKSYEELGMKRAEAESSTYEQGIKALASMDRVQQIDAITEYNKMKDKLKDYLQKFAASKQVVTEEDIRRFFDEMKNEKNAVPLGQPHFCH